jgi:Ni/Fe-hydrogenase subunit HybB-like protein
MSQPASHPPSPGAQTLPTAGRPTASHWSAYPRFLLRVLNLATDGSPLFYVWMFVLTAIALVGANTWATQATSGMAITHLSDHVSWGLYIANFTFLVGLAAGGVMMVIPAYLYDDHDMHDVVIIGELLAVAALVMRLGFVVVDLGRPDRFWHILPGVGRFNWPISMLTWDVIVLNGYLLLNLHICGYLLYMRWLGRRPDPRWYLPFVFISIAWAISIHTVTAFLYAGLGGRPLWNSALLAPRFLASAFVVGPAFVLLTMKVLDRVSTFRAPVGARRTLLGILRISAIINLFMLGVELFTEFYAGGAHAAAPTYLYFGLHGHDALVPWIWTAIVLNVGAVVVFVTPRFHQQSRLLAVALLGTFVGIWIEKGMGLIVAGFVPSTLHEIVEYLPSHAEWKIMAGVWAFGLMVYTVALKVAVTVFGPPRTHDEPEARDAHL